VREYMCAHMQGAGGGDVSVTIKSQWSTSIAHCTLIGLAVACPIAFLGLVEVFGE
jgi:hypothetical protein